MTIKNLFALFFSDQKSHICLKPQASSLKPILCLLLVCLPVCSFVSGQEEFFEKEPAWTKREVVTFVQSSVVHLETKSVQPSGFGKGGAERLKRVEETGSGVLVEIEKVSYVLTNRHIVMNVELDEIRIFLPDRRVLKPKRVLSNADFDVALLEIRHEDIDENSTFASIGNSDLVEVADDILTFGSPFGLSGSVSSGIISAKDRRKIPLGQQTVPIQSFFQTDAATNPGNSGGPMVNMRGEVIGIITAIASSGGGNEGVAFAIPINAIMRSAKQLIEYGTVLRPYLGVELDPNFDWDAAESAGLDRMIGARITKIKENSPGEKAGLAIGDIIVGYDEITVEDDAHLVILVAESKIGHAPKLEILRDRKNATVSPILTER